MIMFHQIIMLLKKYKIIKKVWFIRSNTLNKECLGSCKLFTSQKTCHSIMATGNRTFQDLCVYANSYEEDDYIPLDYAIGKYKTYVAETKGPDRKNRYDKVYKNRLQNNNLLDRS